MTDYRISQLPVVTDAVAGDFILINKGNSVTNRIDVKELVENIGDLKYLRTDSAAGDQTVLSTGTTTFAGLTEHGGGVNVTSGNIFVDLGRVSASGSSTGQSFNATFKGTNSTALKGLFVSATSGSTATDVYGVQVGANLSNNVTKSGSAYGVHSSILSGEINSYNFYAAGDAPNFFTGNTYIGGTTARNTRQLWESTLTEEQKEQLAAGTLVVPANVALPGDGEFARQWWYDQQSAENQALIDAGELDYPTHLAAATFTDTFALGDNTKINLISDGSAEFASNGVVINSNSHLKVNPGIAVGVPGTGTFLVTANSSISPRIGIIRAGNKRIDERLFVISTADSPADPTANEPDTDGVFNISADGSVFSKGIGEFSGGVKVTGGSSNVSDMNAGITSNGGVQLQFVTNKQVQAFMNGNGSLYFEKSQNISTDQTCIADIRNLTLDTAGQEYISFNAASNFLGEKFSQVTRFRASDSNLGKVDNFYGFYSSISPRTNDDGSTRESYNFYAAGTAPNYFSGLVKIASDPTKDSSDLFDGADNTSGFHFSSQGNFVSKRIVNNTVNVGAFTAQVKDSNPAQTTGNFTQALARFTFIQSTGATAAGDIRGDGTGAIILQQPSDYRTKENIVDLPSAVDAIKALRPVNYNYTWAPGRTRPGFVAHELQETLPAAVVGEKDATEAIGTLADYDGTILETEVTEPAELEYTEDVETDGVTTQVVRTRSWTPTGTRPVYQGVDQTKLIPLLTKALQEALERIETLEALIN